MKNKKNRSHGRSQIIGEVHYLVSMGKDFVKSSNVLHESNGGGSPDYFNTINLLASQILELLPKSLIATKICLDRFNCSPQQIRIAINKKLNCLGHELNDIFYELPDFMKMLGIIKIERINNSVDKNIFIDEFRFTIKDDLNKQKIIRIKNLEASRYGLFSKYVDAGFCSYVDIKNIIYFINKLQIETEKERVNMINEFDNYADTTRLRIS